MRLTGKYSPCVWRLQIRYIEEGVDDLARDKALPSRILPSPEATRLAIIAKTTNETPANATQWSRETMAVAMSISPPRVGHILREAGLKLHLVKSFKISNKFRV